MDEPTRGIDVGARSEIYGLLYGLAEAGRTVIVVSSDLAEVIGVADRVMVMREGKIIAPGRIFPTIVRNAALEGGTSPLVRKDM